MKSIKCHFIKLNETSFTDVLNNHCVYVIWDSQAKKKATHIGISENGAHRLSKLKAVFAKPMDGYIAIFESRDEALLVESLLIDIGQETDRIQARNVNSGHLKLLNNFFDRFGKIKIYIHNFDPFMHPKSAVRLSEPKKIIIDDDSYSDDFRKRRAS